MLGRASPVERRVMRHSEIELRIRSAITVAGRELGTGEHGDQFFPAISRRKIGFPNAFAQDPGHYSKHLIADAVPEIVVEHLEFIDVDHEDADRLAFFHRRDLGDTKEFLKRTAVWQTRERVGPGPLLRLVQRIADHVQFAGLLDKAVLQFRRTSGGLRQLVHQTFDQQFWIDAGFAAVGDIADGPYLRTVVRNRGGQELLRRRHHRMKLFGNVVDGGGIGRMRPDIGHEQVMIG